MRRVKNILEPNRETAPLRPFPIVGILAMRRLSQRALAAATGFTSSYCSQANNGIVWPSKRYRSACAAWLGDSEESLFGDEAASR